MKGKKNLLILFSCVFMIIIAGLFACTRSAKEIIPSSEYRSLRQCLYGRCHFSIFSHTD